MADVDQAQGAGGESVLLKFGRQALTSNLNSVRLQKGIAANKRQSR